MIDINSLKAAFQPVGTVSCQPMQQNMGINAAAIANNQPVEVGIAVKE